MRDFEYIKRYENETRVKITWNKDGWTTGEAWQWDRHKYDQQDEPGRGYFMLTKYKTMMYSRHERHLEMFLAANWTGLRIHEHAWYKSSYEVNNDFQGNSSDIRRHRFPRCCMNMIDDLLDYLSANPHIHRILNYEYNEKDNRKGES